MGIIEKILAFQMNHDLFSSEEDKVLGIARLAVDNGYNHLTDRQKMCWRVI